MDKLIKNMVKFLIILFLGFFGVHKFIDKEYKKGILYLFTIGLFGFGWFIDLVFCGINIIKCVLNLLEESKANNVTLTNIQHTSSINKDEIVDNNIKKGNIITENIYLDIETIELLRKKYISFDIETTGLSSMNDRIIEIGAVLFENGKCISEFSSLVHSEILVSDSATEVNHITNEMLANAPKEELVFSKFTNYLEKALNGEIIICAHNANFDISFLKETLERLGYNGKIKYLDTLNLSRRLIKGLDNYKQCTISKYFNINNEQTHRAVTDAMVCGQILWRLIELSDKEFESVRIQIEKSKPLIDELYVCSVIQSIISKEDRNVEWLRYIRNNSNYVDVKYGYYSILKFKITKKGKYIILPKNKVKSFDFELEECSASEGKNDFVRVIFNSIFEIEKLSNIIFEEYNNTKDSFWDYVNGNVRKESEARKYISTLTKLNEEQVIKYLIEGKQKEIEVENAKIEEQRYLEIVALKREKEQNLEIKKLKELTPKVPKGRAIYQMNDNFEIIQKYKTISDAVRQTGVNSKSIRDAANKIQKHAGGFVWRFVDEYENNNPELQNIKENDKIKIEV